MKSPIRIITCLVFIGHFASSQETLPMESQALIDKLNRYEIHVRKDAEEKIFEKRIDVAKALEVHLQKQTRSGNLEDAVKIKAMISTLTSAPKIKEQDQLQREKGHRTNQKLERWLVGTSWSWKDDDRGEEQITFLAGNSLKVSWNDQSLPWDVTRDGKVEIRTFNKELYLIEFSEDRTTFYGSHEAKGEITGRFEGKE